MIGTFFLLLVYEFFKKFANYYNHFFYQCHVFSSILIKRLKLIIIRIRQVQDNLMITQSKFCFCNLAIILTDSNHTYLKKKFIWQNSQDVSKKSNQILNYINILSLIWLKNNWNEAGIVGLRCGSLTDTT